MRTTITLDDDLAVRLDRRRTELSVSFKDVLNEVLRAGLTVVEGGTVEPRRIVPTQPLALGRRLVDIDDVTDALAVAEGEDFR